MDSPKVRITELRIKNFKSIAAAKITFEPLTIFVGPNGVGKSNILDALAFLSDAMRMPLDKTFDQHGGADLFHVDSYPMIAGIFIKFFVIDANKKAEIEYGFEFTPSLEKNSSDLLSVTTEICNYKNLSTSDIFSFERKCGVTNISSITEQMIPQVKKSSLLLPLLSALPNYKEVYDILTSLKVYSFFRPKVEGFQLSSSESILNTNLDNNNQILYDIEQKNNKKFTRLLEFLKGIYPALSQMSTVKFKDFIVLTYYLKGINDEFNASTFSDGTKRCLLILTALFQLNKPVVMSFEEVETSIHPGAIEVLMDAISHENDDCQILLTTHSPEVLNHSSVKPKNIRLVEWVDGKTRVSPVSQGTVKLIQEHLMGAGNLLLSNALQPEEDEPINHATFDLFE